MSKSVKKQPKKKSARSQKKLKTLISNNVEILRRLSNQ
jgi:hypothetical protein